MDLTRRTVLGGSASVLTIATLAGCLGDDDEDDDDTNGDDDSNGTDDTNGSDDDANGDEPEGLAIGEFQLRYQDDDTDGPYVHDDHWDASPLVVPIDDSVPIGAAVEDEDGDEIELGDDVELGVELVEGAEEIVEFEEHGDHVDVHGEEEGFTDVVFQLIEDDDVVYETPELEVQVGDDLERDHDDHGHDDDDDHGHDDDDDH